MSLVVATVMADRQVLLMAAAPFAQRLNMLQRGVLRRYMLAAHPARHRAMQLAGHCSVNLVAGVRQLAHTIATAYKSAANSMRLRPAALAA